jgi:predicted phage tail protein
MTPVYLYGALGRKFGHRWSLDVQSPAEAIRLIIANRPDFERYLIQHSRPGYQVFVGPDPITNPDHLRLNGTKAIKIVPVVAGAKDQGIGIIIGAVIVAAAIISFQYELLPFALTTAAGGLTVAGSIVAGVGFMGAGLVIGGIGQLLAGSPQTPAPAELAQNKPSFFFNGPVNTTQQGQPVPVCLGGPIRVGSAVISAGISTEDIGL